MSVCLLLCGDTCCVLLVMDIRISPHRDIVAFKDLFDSWIESAGKGCSYKFIYVSLI